MRTKLFIGVISVCFVFSFASPADTLNDACDSLILLSEAKIKLSDLEFNGLVEFANADTGWNYRRCIWNISNVIGYIGFIEDELKKGKESNTDWKLILENALKAENRLYTASSWLDRLFESDLIRFKWLSYEFVFKDCIQDLREAQNLIYSIKTEAMMNIPPSSSN